MHTVELSSEGNQPLIRIQKHRGTKKKKTHAYTKMMNEKEDQEKRKHTHT